MKNYLQPIFVLLLLPIIFSCNSVVNKKEVPLPKTTNLSLLIDKNKAEGRSPLFMSKDFGVTWQAATNDLPSDLQVSFLESKGTEIVLASDNKGIFISQDRQSKWEQINHGLPNQKINALHISEGAIYAGIYQAGIYQTMDEGKSWGPLNYNLPNLRVQSILKLDKQLLVGTDEGVFILPNNSKTWITTNLTSQVLSIYAYDDKLVAGTSLGTAISSDNGITWEWIRKKGTVHYTHNIGKKIIELALNGDLVSSDDWGANWQNTQYQPRKGSYIYEIIEVGDYQLLSNNYGIHRSKDKGQNWELVYKTESMAFFDFLTIGDVVYGGTRKWDEYREKSATSQILELH